MSDIDTGVTWPIPNVSSAIDSVGRLDRATSLAIRAIWDEIDRLWAELDKRTGRDQ